MYKKKGYLDMTSYKDLYELALEELSTKDCTCPCLYTDNCTKCWDEYIRKSLDTSDNKNRQPPLRSDCL